MGMVDIEAGEEGFDDVEDLVMGELLFVVLSRIELLF